MDNFEVQINEELPRDTEGFVRRACPTCAKELKWLANMDVPPELVATGELHCPYCGAKAPQQAWWTGRQTQYVHELMRYEVACRVYDDLKKRLGTTGGRRPQRPGPLPPEPDDMKQTAPQCHLSAVVKVSDDWDDAVFCIVCGQHTCP
jgi:hypothetical protein